MREKIVDFAQLRICRQTKARPLEAQSRQHEQLVLFGKHERSSHLVSDFRREEGEGRVKNELIKVLCVIVFFSFFFKQLKVRHSMKSSATNGEI